MIFYMFMVKTFLTLLKTRKIWGEKIGHFEANKTPSYLHILLHMFIKSKEYFTVVNVYNDLFS